MESKDLILSDKARQDYELVKHALNGDENLAVKRWQWAAMAAMVVLIAHSFQVGIFQAVRNFPQGYHRKTAFQKCFE